MALAELLGVEIEHAGEGASTLGLQVNAGHLNKADVVHGGVICTLVDMAIGLSVRSVLAPGSQLATTSLNVAFLLPCRGARIRAEGRVISRGRRLVFGEARVWSGDALVAQGAGTWYVSPPGAA